MRRISEYVLIAVLLAFLAPHDVLDLTTPYNGASALLSGENPYSEEVTQRNQVTFYGHVVGADEDQMRTGYPLTALMVYAPLTAIPLEIAVLVYRVGASLLLIAALVRLGAPPLWAFVVLVAMREPVTAFALGQASLLTAACIAFGLDALRRQQPTRAAVCFALASVHPTIAIPLAFAILLPYRRAFLRYVALMLAWFALSLVVGGWWVSDWFAVVRSYPGYVNFMVWMPRLFPLIVPVGVTLALFAYRERELMRRYALTVSAAVLLLPLTGLYHLTLFAPVFTRFRRWQVAAFGACLWTFALAPFEIRQFAPLAFAGVVALQYGLNQKRTKLGTDRSRGTMHRADVVGVTSN